jgi:hypothetical protein
MSKVARPNSRDEKALMTELWDSAVADDLLQFVMFTFPWGKRGTPLEKYEGPRSWQREELERVTEHIRDNRIRVAKGEDPRVYQSATASGRGSGKSTLTAWLNWWMLTTRLGSTCIDTANTEDQLKSRTWAELGKWHTLAINSHWFDRTALSLRPHSWFEEALKSQMKIDTGYYYALAQLWSEEKPDAFAGVHNDKGLLVAFDEASGIVEPIWTVTEGFFTEPIVDRYWFAFSNPRRNTGSFYECFHKHRKYWHRRNLDSRTVEGTDGTRFQSIIDKYGDDSDTARIEVYGQFPKQGAKQFISREGIEAARDRALTQIDSQAALMMGVDVARYGDDTTVIRFRQGRDARSIPPIKIKDKDNMEVANTCAHWIHKVRPDGICIDAGSGTGVIDRLREMKYRVHEVWFGSKSSDSQWANKRTELWALMRDWLAGACIDDDSDLVEDLAGPEYGFQGRSDRIILEPKEQMKKRGLASPDNADALAVTFAVKVARRDFKASLSNLNRRTARDIDYSILG